MNRRGHKSYGEEGSLRAPAKAIYDVQTEIEAGKRSGSHGEAPTRQYGRNAFPRELLELRPNGSLYTRYAYRPQITGATSASSL